MFFKNYVAVSSEAARYLASRDLRAVGIDGPSVGSFERAPGHTGSPSVRGIWIVEWLDLQAHASELA